MKTVYDLAPGLYFICQDVGYEAFVLVVEDCGEGHGKLFTKIHLDGSQGGEASIIEAKTKRLSDYRTLVKIDYTDAPTDDKMVYRIVPQLIEMSRYAPAQKSNKTAL